MPSYLDTADLVRLMPHGAVYGLPDWEEEYGPLAESERSTPLFPWDEEVLRSTCPFNPGYEVRETHFAFLGMASVGEKPVDWEFFKEHIMHDLRIDKSISNQLARRWYLMPLEPVYQTRFASYEQALRDLPDRYEVPTLFEEFTKQILGLNARRAENWMEDQWETRGSDQGPGQTHAMLLLLTDRHVDPPPWLRAIYCPDRAITPTLGLAASRAI